MARTAPSLGLSLWRSAPFGRPLPLLAGLLAACLPLVFLHVRYQPSLEVRAGSTVVGVQLSDLAILAVVGAGLAAALALGLSPLRTSLPVWGAAAAFLVLVGASTLHPLAWRQDYAFLTHLVTALKFGEYALIAPALALLLRRRWTLDLLVATVVAWSAAATGWGLLQFLGAVPGFEGAGAGRRAPSFLGIHDLAALSGAALAVAVAVLALGPSRPRDKSVAWLAGVAGGLGLVLSAALAALVGVGLAAATALGVAAARGALVARRAATLALLVGLVTAGVVLMRSGDIGDFARFLGLGQRREGGVETYTQRTLLAYIGLRIFFDHPLTGVGWQGSGEPESFRPYLAAARRRFPGAPSIAFPSAAHPWGVQNAYLQAAADMGVLGLVALVAVLATSFVQGARTARQAPRAVALPTLACLGWLLVASGTWNGVGLVAGIPLLALTWIAVGALAACSALARQAGDGRG
ncbi:MAG: hypothetical protein C4306_07770 [Thermoleophilia bacterium]